MHSNSTCRVRRHALVLFAALIVTPTVVRSQTTIELSDIMSWETGEYLHYSTNHDSAIWPCFWDPPYQFVVDTGMVWDFRNVPFQDTLLGGLRPPTAAELSEFPNADLVHESEFHVLREQLYFPTRAALEVSTNAVARRGLLVERSTGVLEELYEWPDTLVDLPMAYGDVRRSSMYYGRQPGSGAEMHTGVPNLELDWVDREISTYGKLVTPKGDTLDVLGLAEIGHGREWLSSDVVSFGIHTYTWFAKDIGVVAFASIGVDSSRTGVMTDTTLFGLGSGVDLCNASYFLRALAVRIIPDPHSVAPQPAGLPSLSKAMPTGESTQRRAFDILGRSLGRRSHSTTSQFLVLDAGELVACIVVR
ncbi:MAG: hypothetical protein GF331_14015 [Chitinivibrionales bacterium]|nr:hypothetical protein [Chitinivibrionales bacterium]